MPEPILVVGAALVDDLDLPRVLTAARRSAPPALAGKWEFPGGKVERGEEPTEALRRELREELRVEVELGAELPGPEAFGLGRHGAVIGSAWPLAVTHDGSPLAMRVWLARIVSGEAEPREDHDALRPLAPGEWTDVDWIEADAPIVEALIETVVKKHRASWC